MQDVIAQVCRELQLPSPLQAIACRRGVQHILGPVAPLPAGWGLPTA